MRRFEYCLDFEPQLNVCQRYIIDLEPVGWFEMGAKRVIGMQVKRICDSTYLI